MVPRKRGDDSRRVLPWALLLSVLTHAVLIPALLWFIVLHLIAPSMLKPAQDLALTTSVTLAKSTAKTVAPQTHNVPKVAPQPRPVLNPIHAPPPPRELAHVTPNATAAPQQPVQPRNPSFGQTLAAQQAQFAREAQQLHAQNNPLNVPTSAPYVPTTIKRSYFDDPGYQKRIHGGFAYLTPLEHFEQGTLSCYYVHYLMDFNSGGSDEGNIPWPVCYPHGHDAIASGQRYLPVPFPQPGYVLPAGTYIAQWLKENVYDQRPQ